MRAMLRGSMNWKGYDEVCVGQPQKYEDDMGVEITTGKRRSTPELNWSRTWKDAWCDVDVNTVLVTGLRTDWSPRHEN